MYQKLVNTIEESGIWAGQQRESHRFLLSPSVYKLTEGKCDELKKIGFALNECLVGLSHIANISYNQELNYGQAWLLARRVFSTGVPKFYQNLQATKIKQIPKLLKVDFMVDQAGQFKIAEIDGHNKHGLGYTSLAKRLRESIYPNSPSLPGAVKVLSGEIREMGHNEVKIFYADQERFYLPEFKIAQLEFARNNIDCQIISEMEITEDILSTGLFLDLPFLYQKPELYDIIIPAYINDEVEFIIPPKPFLGAKGVLALLRNDMGNDHLESILRSFINIDSLLTVRNYIPQTWLVGKQSGQRLALKDKILKQRFVLKESISSGMKGTIFCDDKDFEFHFNKANSSNLNWILQEEVVNQPQTFSWYEGPALHTKDDWFMRVTAHYINRQLGDVIVTACRDKAVHGGKNCLQIGTIII
jgi:hypothetical protein